MILFENGASSFIFFKLSQTNPKCTVSTFKLSTFQIDIERATDIIHLELNLGRKGGRDPFQMPT